MKVKISILLMVLLCAGVCLPQDKALEKQARDEVSKALKEKRIGALDIGKYYELINIGKASEVIKELHLEESAVLGGLGFTPSEKQPFGWRGDGSGKYPDANPPLDWERISKAVKTISVSVKKSRGAPDKSEAAPDGVIRRWLVAGPFASLSDSEEVLPNEKALSPEEKDKAGNSAWKAVTIDNSCLDFCSELDIPRDKPNYTVYAYTNIYYSSNEKVVCNLLYERGVKAWLNGVEIHNASRNAGMGLGACRLPLPLQNGWNRLLIRVNKGAADRKGCWLTFGIYGDGEDNSEYDSKGIAWSVMTAGPGSSSPVIVGDKIFITCEDG
ncbi:MAG: hypothetical protein WCI43_07585, partial [Candidatus Firestonebacteria bacterium]